MILSLCDFLAAQRGRVPNAAFKGGRSPQLAYLSPCLTPQAAYLGTPTQHISRQGFLGQCNTSSRLSSPSAWIPANHASGPLVYNSHNTATGSSSGNGVSNGVARILAAGQVPPPLAAAKLLQPSDSKLQRSQPSLLPLSPGGDHVPVPSSLKAAATTAAASQPAFKGGRAAAKPAASPPMPELNPAAWRAMLRPVMVGPQPHPRFGFGPGLKHECVRLLVHEARGSSDWQHEPHMHVPLKTAEPWQQRLRPAWQRKPEAAGKAAMQQHDWRRQQPAAEALTSSCALAPRSRQGEGHGPCRAAVPAAVAAQGPPLGAPAAPAGAGCCSWHSDGCARGRRAASSSRSAAGRWVIGSCSPCLCLWACRSVSGPAC